MNEQNPRYNRGILRGNDRTENPISPVLKYPRKEYLKRENEGARKSEVVYIAKRRDLLLYIARWILPGSGRGVSLVLQNYMKRKNRIRDIKT